MKKTIYSMVIILAFSVIANICFIIILLSMPSSKIQEAEVPRECEETEVKEPDNQQKELISSYTSPALLYVKTTKTGKSTDLYIDRLKDVKDILSQDVYNKLTPNMSDEEIESARKHAADTNQSLISTTSVLDTDISYKKQAEGVYEIYIIYTLQTDRNTASSTQRYLCRLEVNRTTDKYLITNIFEDSILENGIY